MMNSPGRMGKRSATIVDVAKLAGVSWKTVSRVVNRNGSVSATTTERVEAAIKALDFWPNTAARSLAGTRSFLIGALTTNPSAHYVAELHRGAAGACREKGYHLTIEELETGPTLISGLKRNLRQVRLDGVLLCPPMTDNTELLDFLDQAHIRYVRLSPAANIDRSDAVYADDHDGVAALVRHLWELGHRRLAVVKGPESHGAAPVRYAAFLDAVEELGGQRNAVQSAPGDFSFESGVKAGLSLLRRVDRPTAIFASNDEMAAGVIAAAGELSLSVPTDVSVAGFDDSNLAQMIWPPLTTVRQPIAKCARLAVELLIDQAPDGRARQLHCPVELVVRRSTARPRLA